MKKIVTLILIILIALILLGILGAGYLFKDELTILKTLKKEDDTIPLYTLEINSDYHFDEFLKIGGASSDSEVSAYLTKCISHGFYNIDAKNKGAGCSVLSAMTSNGSHLWGRNFDWTEAVPIIVKCHPQKGYASISTCEFGNITGDSKVLPEGMKNKMLAIAALYVPMDGINEKGLCVADLEVNEGGMLDKDTSKPDLTITTAIRLVLNQAATVDEAIDLLSQYDIHPSGGISHHLALSDSSGTSVSLEFVNGKMISVPSPYLTNFNLANGDITAGGESPQRRYETLEKLYNEDNGILTIDKVKEALMDTAQKEGDWRTQWSIVYDDSTHSANYYFHSNFDKPFHFSL